MCDAILEKPADQNNDMLIKLINEGFISSHDGKLSAEFPVFSSDMIDNTIWQILTVSRRCVRMHEYCCTNLEKFYSESSYFFTSGIAEHIANYYPQNRSLCRQTDSSAIL